MSTSSTNLDFQVFEPSGSANRYRRKSNLWRRLLKAMEANDEARARRMVDAHLRFRTDAELRSYGLTEADLKRIRSV